MAILIYQDTTITNVFIAEFRRSFLKKLKIENIS